MNAKKIKVVRLYRKGLTQKQISKQEGLTEKTVGIWLKGEKQSEKDTIVNIEILNERLNILIGTKTASIQDIKSLTDVINKLETRFFN